MAKKTDGTEESTKRQGHGRRHPIGVDPRRDTRRERATSRAVARTARTAAQQLEEIMTRPGSSTREVARLRGVAA